MDNNKSIKEQLESYIEELFAYLGIDLNEYIIKNGTIRGPAPCHDGNNKTAFTYYYLSGSWSCWSHGCNRQYGSDPIGLIMATKKVSFKEALDIANDFLSGKEIPTNGVLNRKIAKEIKKKDEWKEHLEQPEQNEYILMKSPYFYAKNRGLNSRILKWMGIGYAKKGTLRNRIVVPIRNIEGKTIGFTGRKAHDFLPGPKWMHYKLNTRINLFNINRVLKKIKKNKSIILCEGPWDVVKFEMAGYPAVCIFGLYVHNGQIEILNKCGIMKVYLALDNDEPGKRAINDNVKKLERSLFDVEVISAKDAKDFGDMEIKKIRKTMEEFSL